MKPSMKQIAEAFKSYFSRHPLAKMLKINNTLKLTDDGKLGVNITDEVTEGNNLPVTARAVREKVDAIDSILDDI